MTLPVHGAAPSRSAQTNRTLVDILILKKRGLLAPRIEPPRTQACDAHQAGLLPRRGPCSPPPRSPRLTVLDCAKTDKQKQCRESQNICTGTARARGRKPCRWPAGSGEKTCPVTEQAWTRTGAAAATRRSPRSARSVRTRNARRLRYVGCVFRHVTRHLLPCCSVG